jgi:hypothetical protein
VIPTFAVVGQPNKGKSSIVATLAEDERIAIAPTPGTTRSAHRYTLSIDGTPQFHDGEGGPLRGVTDGQLGVPGQRLGLGHAPDDRTPEKLARVYCRGSRVPALRAGPTNSAAPAR